MKTKTCKYAARLTLIWSIVIVGCKPLQINDLSDRLSPSNIRTWTPELAVLPSAEFEANQIHIKNIRNINYLNDDNFVVKYYDRSIQLDEIKSVDFVVTPFNNAPAIAHTMLSFGLTDGTYLGLSVEIRNELGEDYSPLLGISNQFEICYVIADEKDLIRVRTHHRDSDVYVYPSVANAEQSQKLFADVLQRVNELNVRPEFYNTIRNNCTTNLVDHVNKLRPDRVPFNWRVLLPGFSAEYAYKIGLLDNRVPFEDLKNIAHVNDLVQRHYDDPAFSQKIRNRRTGIERLAKRQQMRQSTLSAAGSRYIEENFTTPRIWR